MSCVESAADRTPDADLLVAAIREHRRRHLQYDCEGVEAAEIVHRLARRAEPACRWLIWQLRERPAHRFPIGDYAEELLEVEEERIIADTGERST